MTKESNVFLQNMEVLAGQVVNYYRTIGVASIRVNDVLEVGDSIHIKGHTTDFEQTVGSLQIGHRMVNRVSAGEIAGLKVKDFVRKHDCIYRIMD
jgi:hypothetical protein